MTRRLLSALAVLLALAAPAAAQVNSVAGSQVVVTPNAAAYVAGNCLGGVLTAPGLVRSHGPGGAILTGINFVDPATQTGTNDAQTILVFNTAPVGTYTDHAACSLAPADIPNLVGTISIPAANCTQPPSPAGATICTVSPVFSVPQATSSYSLATSATSAAGTFVLTFTSVPSYITVGMLATDTTAAVIPNGATVTATTSTTVTINQAITGAGVGNGDNITFTRTAPTINSALWFIPIIAATPTYGANKLTYTFMTQPFGN
jgi:hypothetical protein